MGLDQLRQAIISYAETSQDESDLQNVVTFIQAKQTSIRERADDDDLTEEQLSSLRQAASDAFSNTTKDISIEEFKAKHGEWL